MSVSYRQVCRAYPNGGGAYIVARTNLAPIFGLIAAAALLYGLYHVGYGMGLTEIGFLQRIFSMVALTLAQWSICIGLALSLVVIEELIKVFVRRRGSTAAPVDDPRVAAVA